MDVVKTVPAKQAINKGIISFSEGEIPLSSHFLGHLHLQLPSIFKGERYRVLLASIFTTGSVLRTGV